MGTINIFRTTAVLLAVVTCSSSVEDKAHWRKIALDDITRKLYHTPNTRVAKNVVLMIGDGMGISTVTSARILKGQLKGKAGEETFLNFEKFPYTGLSKVYSQDYQVPDSAATASAMMTGVKTNSRCMGVDGLAMPGECRNLTERRLNGMGHWANDAGKSTGFVTTSRVTHATPAAMYAVTTNRDWEDDRSVPKNTGSPYCTDIAWQLIHNNSHMNVIMGGGSANFVPTTASDPVTLRSGRRLDDTNLIEVWKNDKIQRNANYSKAYNAKQLEDIDPANTQYLLGLFASSHMAYELDRNKEPEGEPSLADMTRKAIQVLSNNDNGFFLMVEGARIDHGHHETKAKKALYDTLAFEEAVQVVMDTTREEETLIIVTADHSHVLTINGYPHRGNGILDVVRPLNLTQVQDGLPYTTLSYANGPGAKSPRTNLTGVNTTTDAFQQPSFIHLSSETHSGEDVAIYARGPMAHLLTGVKEQNVIAYVMAYAACVGDIGIGCQDARTAKQTGGSTTNIVDQVLLLSAVVTYIVQL